MKLGGNFAYAGHLTNLGLMRFSEVCIEEGANTKVSFYAPALLM